MGEPLVDLSDKADVAQAQIVIGDPAAAREQVEDELDVGLVNVLRQVLEPLSAGRSSALGARHQRLARRLVGDQGGRDIVFP